MKLSFASQQQTKVHILFFTILVIILSVAAIFLFFPMDTLILGDDARFHFSRFLCIYDAINEGRFPFYINSSPFDGYGYATNLFYPDLYLVPFTFLIDSIGAVSAYKVMIFGAFLICAFVSYYSVNKMLNNRIVAIIFGLLYTFCLYRLTDMSLRGSIGELWAFIFLPVVFWGIHEILYGDYKRRWYIIGIGFAGLILTHLISASLVFIVLFFCILYNCRIFVAEWKRLGYLALAACLAILLSSMFLFPMIEQMLSNKFYYETNPAFDNIAIRSRSIERVITGLFKGFATRNDLVLPMFDVGLLLTLPLAARIFIREKSNEIKSADISLIIGVILLFVMSDLFPWFLFRHTVIESVIQYPWRFLFIISFLFAYAGSIYLYILISDVLLSRSNRIYALYIVMAIFIVVQLRFTGAAFQETMMERSVKEKYITDSNYTFSTFSGVSGGEYIPAKVPSVDYLRRRGDIITFQNPSSRVVGQERVNSKLVLDINVGKRDKAVLPLLYYKGYKAAWQGREIEVNQSRNGLVEIDIPASGHIEVWYDGTFVQRVGWIISVISLILLIIYSRITGRRKSGSYMF